MTKSITQAAGTRDENKIAERLVEKLIGHADSFGVGIDGTLVEGLQDFFAEVVKEERDEGNYDETYDGLTAYVVECLAGAMQRFAASVEEGDF